MEPNKTVTYKIEPRPTRPATPGDATSGHFRGPFIECPFVSSGKLAVMLMDWDLVEHARSIKRGWPTASEWRMIPATMDKSWVGERPYWMLDHNPAAPDSECLQELTERADLLHLTEHHNWQRFRGLKAGKRIVMMHHSCIYRDNPGQYERQEVDAGYTRIVSTPDLLLYGTKSYRDTLQWLPLPVDLQELDTSFPRFGRGNRREVVVAHGFTVKSNKDPNDDLPRIVGELQAQQVPIHLDAYTKLTRQMSLWKIAQADIYFATWLYGPGMASLEAMALRVPVVLSCSPDELAIMRERLGTPLPFVHVTRENCAKTLRELVNDPALRFEVAEHARAYVERVHDCQTVAEKLLYHYEHTEPCKEIVLP